MPNQNKVAMWKNQCIRSGPSFKELVDKSSFSKEAKHYQEMHFKGVRLDDWKSVPQALSKYKAPVKIICLSECFLTKRAAKTLGWMLDNKKSGFQIEELSLSNPKGSSTWMPGLYKNTSIRSLKLQKIPMKIWYGFLHFLEHGEANQQLEHVECCGVYQENDRKKLRFTSDSNVLRPKTQNALSLNRRLSFNVNNGAVGGESSLQNSPIRTLKILCLEVGLVTSTHCQRTLGNILRRCTGLEKLHLVGLQKPDYDFIQDAIHCKHLILKDTGFDPATITTLVNEGLKYLDIYGRDGNSQIMLRTLLDTYNHFDLTKLNQLTVTVDVNDEAFEFLCHQLGSNRGPRHLCINLRILHKFADETVRVAYKEGIEILVASLQNNDKIEQLEMGCWYGRPSFNDDDDENDRAFFHLFLQLISTMPSLTDLIWRGQAILYKSRAQKESVNEIRKLVLQHVGKSKTIRHAYFPFSDNLQHVLEEIPFRQLIKYQDNLSDGIWAHALSHKKKTIPVSNSHDNEYKSSSNVSRRLSVMQEQTKMECGDDETMKMGKITTNNAGKNIVVPNHSKLSTMYSIICQVPWLFQQAGIDDNEKQQIQ